LRREEKRRECFEQRDEDLELDCVPNLKNPTFESVASVLVWQNRLNYLGSSAQAITIKATLA